MWQQGYYQQWPFGTQQQNSSKLSFNFQASIANETFRYANVGFGLYNS